MVIVARIGHDVRAYPVDTDEVALAHDHVGNEPIVVFIDGGGGAAVSRWDVAGLAIQGPLAGHALQ